MTTQDYKSLKFNMHNFLPISFFGTIRFKLPPHKENEIVFYCSFDSRVFGL